VKFPLLLWLGIALTVLGLMIHENTVSKRHDELRNLLIEIRDRLPPR
jgi:hypothetical protein